jgi:hypothetical protein
MSQHEIDGQVSHGIAGLRTLRASPLSRAILGPALLPEAPDIPANRRHGRASAALCTTARTDRVRSSMSVLVGDLISLTTCESQFNLELRRPQSDWVFDLLGRRAAARSTMAQRWAAGGPVTFEGATGRSPCLSARKTCNGA